MIKTILYMNSWAGLKMVEKSWTWLGRVRNGREGLRLEISPQNPISPIILLPLFLYMREDSKSFEEFYEDKTIIMKHF